MRDSRNKVAWVVGCSYKPFIKITHPALSQQSCTCHNLQPFCQHKSGNISKYLLDTKYLLCIVEDWWEIRHGSSVRVGIKTGDSDIYIFSLQHSNLTFSHALIKNYFRTFLTMPLKVPFSVLEPQPPSTEYTFDDLEIVIECWKR